MTTSTLNQASPCKIHGVVERTKNRTCKKCVAERLKIYRRKYPEKGTAKKKKWNKNNPYSSVMVKESLKGLKTYKVNKLSFKDIPPELVEIRRLQMQLYHAIKAANQ